MRIIMLLYIFIFQQELLITALDIFKDLSAPRFERISTKLLSINSLLSIVLANQILKDWRDRNFFKTTNFLLKIHRHIYFLK